MNLTIISGGQTGCDQAALRAARAAGIPTAGYVPRGWKTEYGRAPWLKAYGIVEIESSSYAERTRRCVHDCHGVIWFGDPNSPGGRCTMREARLLDKPVFRVKESSTHKDAAGWIRVLGLGLDEVKVLVAGNRESTLPGIGAKTEAFMAEVFRLLGERQK